MPSFEESVQIMLGGDEILVAAPPYLAGHEALGLAVVHAFFALVIVIIASVAAAMTSVVLKRRSSSAELAPLVGAGLTVFIVVTAGHVVWGYLYRDPLLPLSVAFALALPVWIVLRVPASKHDQGWRFDWMLQYTFPVPFAVAMINMAVYMASRRMWPAAITYAAGAALAIAFAVWGFRSKSVASRVALRLALPAAIFVLAASSLVTTTTDGAVRATGSHSTSDKKPNIAIIVLDTVRADHLRRYGYARNTMPALEEWADRATVFRRAVSPGGWTAASRASLFSGLPVSLHGVHLDRRENAWNRRIELNLTHPFPGIEWLPKKLGEHGYYTLAVSSNELAANLARLSRFDRVLDAEVRRRWMNNMAASVEKHTGPIVRLSERLRWMRPYLDAKEIVDRVERALPEQDAPVFLFVNFMDAHSPYNPPAIAFDLLGLERGHSFSRGAMNDENLARLDSIRREDMKQELIDLYDGELRYLDVHLARLFDLIDERLGADTIIVVTSDHGEELGERGYIGHFFGLPQSLVHVPLLVRMPGREPAELDDLVTVRNVYDFVIGEASGAGNGFDALVLGDEFGVLSERYPGTGNRAPLQRAWVALFEGDYKGVGPQPEEFRLYDLKAQGIGGEARRRHHSLRNGSSN